MTELMGGSGIANSVFLETSISPSCGDDVKPRRMKNFILLLLMLVVTASGQSKPADDSKLLTLMHVTIIDVTGAPSKSDMTVVIKGGKIIQVGNSRKLKPLPSSQVIDASGKFLIPGLWDMHVHLGDEDFDKNSYLQLFIANGVTGVRIMEGDPVFHTWRRDIENKTLLGPRMMIASRVIGADDLSNLSVEKTLEEVRRAKQENADFIKVHDNVLRDSYFALIKEAKSLNLPVEGHVPISITAAEASQAGQKSIEHFTGLDEAKTDGNKARILFKILKSNRTWHCPTLIMRHNYALLFDKSFSADPRLKYVKPRWKTRWLKMNQEAQNWTASEISARRQIIQSEDNLLKAEQDAGIMILAGTDDSNPFVMPGFSLHDELALMVKAGLTPVQALQTATINPAKFFNRLDSLGTIEKGKIADLVLLDANPLVDINNTKKVNAVIVNNRFLDRNALDEILSQIAASAEKK